MLDELPRPLLVLIAIAVVMVVLSALSFLQLNKLGKNISKNDSSKIKVVKGISDSKNTIYVDIEGAVSKPGVYELPQNSRLVDALRACNGLLGSADKYTVAKSFNLAKTVTDEEKVYIPFLEEREIFVPENISQTTTSINFASATQLELIPNIGPKTAQKVIENRPYSNVEELLLKKVVGEKTFEKIKDYLVL
jgi:competence protein ComEA